jgi:hypothetical protein
MPGTPIKNKLIADIAAMGDGERSGDEVILDRIAGGETITGIARELGVSRPFLSGYLNRTPHGKAALKEAIAVRADAHAEKALQLADDVAENPNSIAKAREQIATRKWLAGVENPEKYGAKAATVNVTIGGLHLDALRKVSAELAHPDVVEGEAIDVTPGAADV